MKRAEQRGPVPLVLAVAAVVALALIASLVPAPAARAYTEYQHGGIEDCGICHLNNHTYLEPTHENCLTCHSGYQIVRPGDLCWTCHQPGEDMGWARTDASCLSTCHLRDPREPHAYNVAFTHTVHAGGSTACTTCHKLTAAAETSAGSAHHTVPAPRLDTVTPSSALPGASVTLSGAKFSWASLVRFGGMNAAFSIVSDAVIVATVPKAAVSGPVTVLSAGGAATSDMSFLVLQPPQAPMLTIAATRPVLKLGRRAHLWGRLAPAAAASQVNVVVQRRVSGAWKSVARSLRAADATGAYAWSYKPRTSGAYRARASAAGAVSPWVSFRVR